MSDRIKEILDDYAAELRGELNRGSPAPGMWIFRRNIDHEAPFKAIVALLKEARIEGRKEGAAAIAEQMDYQCACRCQKHRKSACPFCLNVYGCPVHSEVDPSVLRPDFLKDPEAVARAFWNVMAGLPDLEWEALATGYQEHLTEQARRIVTVRLEARRG